MPTSSPAHRLILCAPLLLSAACGDDATTSASASATAGATTTTTTGPGTSTSTTVPTTGVETEGSASESATSDPTTSTTSTTGTTTGTSSTTGVETTDDTSTTTTGTTTTTSTTGTTTTTGGVVCGDAVVDGDEACDQGADNGAPGSCCSDACELLAAVVCRSGSGDMCDPDELCDGLSPLCPDDVVSGAGTVCGAPPADVCLLPPACSGVAGEACGEPAVDDELVCAAASGCSPELACGAVDGQCTCALPPLDGPLDVLIIQSSDFNGGHDMDGRWLAVLTGLGHNASIVPVTTLDSQVFIAGTDVLIVASGVRPYTPTQVANIQAFVEAGKGVYLQSEYLATFDSNKAFATITTALGANFAWTGEVVGQLNPVAVSGCLAGHDGCVGAITYHWYAHAGGAATPGFEPFLSKNGQNIAFSYCPPDPALGAIITTTDQDFLRTGNITPVTEDLMENMFNRIARPQACKP